MNTLSNVDKRPLKIGSLNLMVFAPLPELKRLRVEKKPNQMIGLFLI